MPVTRKACAILNIDFPHLLVALDVPYNNMLTFRWDWLPLCWYLAASKIYLNEMNPLLPGFIGIFTIHNTVHISITDQGVKVASLGDIERQILLA